MAAQQQFKRPAVDASDGAATVRAPRQQSARAAARAVDAAGKQQRDGSPVTMAVRTDGSSDWWEITVGLPRGFEPCAVVSTRRGTVRGVPWGPGKREIPLESRSRDRDLQIAQKPSKASLY